LRVKTCINGEEPGFRQTHSLIASALSTFSRSLFPQDLTWIKLFFLKSTFRSLDSCPAWLAIIFAMIKLLGNWQLVISCIAVRAAFIVRLIPTRQLSAFNQKEIL
jgi:hypothetical protein